MYMLHLQAGIVPYNVLELCKQEILQVMGITACEGMGEELRWSKGEEGEGRGMRRREGGGVQVIKTFSTRDGWWYIGIKDL